MVFWRSLSKLVTFLTKNSDIIIVCLLFRLAGFGLIQLQLQRERDAGCLRNCTLPLHVVLTLHARCSLEEVKKHAAFLCAFRPSLPARSMSASRKTYGGFRMWWMFWINTRSRETPLMRWASVDLRLTSVNTKMRWGLIITGTVQISADEMVFSKCFIKLFSHTLL